MPRQLPPLRSWLIALTAGLCLLPRASSGDDPKDEREAILQIADVLKKGEPKSARQLATAVVRKKGLAADEPGSLDDLMHLFAYRKKEGLGVGPKPEAIRPDGIEAVIEFLAEEKANSTRQFKQLVSEAEALERMAYITAAIAEVTIVAAPMKDSIPRQKRERWLKLSKDMRDGALELAQAISKGDKVGIQRAARALNSTCIDCHTP